MVVFVAAIAVIVTDPPSKITVQTQLVLPLGTMLLSWAGYPSLSSSRGIDPVANPVAFAAKSAKVQT